MILLMGLFGSSSQIALATKQNTLALIDDDRIGPVMQIQVNGIETTAILDTAATIALIDHAHLSDRPQRVWKQEQTRILGLGGLRDYPVTEIEELSIGAQSWNELRVAVNTSHRFPVDHSILPISMFQTSIVDFDFRRSRVHLYNGAPKRERGAYRSTVNYVEQQKLIYIPIRINGVRGHALIDTGAEKSFVNPVFARESRATPNKVDAERMQGVDLSKEVAHLYTFRDFRFGDTRIAKARIPVVRTMLFDQLGYADEPMMVMGMDFLHHFRLQVDRKRKRVTFWHRQPGSNSRLR